MKHTLVAGPLLIGLVLLAAPSTAQTGSVRGRVLDAQQEPVAKAKVLFELQEGMGGQHQVETNDKGEYLRVGLQPGLYRITASAEGHEPAAIDMHVALGDTTEAPDIQLAPSAAAQAGAEAAALREKFGAALALTDAGKFDEAETLYKEILETQPDVPEVLENLGYVYVHKKDWAAAQASYEKVLALRPDHSQVMAALAMVYQQSGQSEKAAELMAKAAGENPQDAMAQFNHGVLLLNSGDTMGAIPSFEAALVADPEMAEAHYQLGTLLIGQGKVPEAIEHLEKYLSMNPDCEQNVATAKGLLQALKK